MGLGAMRGEICNKVGRRCTWRWDAMVSHGMRCGGIEVRIRVGMEIGTGWMLSNLYLSPSISI